MNNLPILKIELIDKSLPMPQYQTKGAAGMDLYLKEEVLLKPNERGFFSTNIKMDIPEGYYVAVKSRSSSFKLGLNIFNGTIDSDYHKEVFVGIENTTQNEISLAKGQRIAQALLQKSEITQIVEDVVEDNERGGFGSTGTH